MDVSWLILQRLDDLRRAQDELKVDVRERLDAFARAQDEFKADVKERLDGFAHAQAELRTEIKALDAKIDRVDGKVDRLRGDLEAKIESVRNWSLGLLLLAILGLLAKLLIPGA